MKQAVLELVCAHLNCSPYNIVGLYPFGSRIYGNHKDSSDYDFICVVKEAPEKETQVLTENININIYRKDFIKSMFRRNDIKAIEIAFLPKDKILKNGGYVFTRNITELRNSISQKGSHSWVKAKKKIEVEKNIYAGKKSLFHSLRILDFGIQVAVHGKIINYGSMNHVYAEILAMDSDKWEDYDGKFRALHNSLKSKFKKVTAEAKEEIKRERA